MPNYRSEIYHDNGAFGPLMVYWSLAEGASAKTAIVFRNEIYPPRQLSTPMHDGELEIGSALKMVEDLDAEAAKNLKPVDMHAYKSFMAAGEEFHRALPFARHPVQIEAVRLGALKNKSAGTRFKLKT